MNDLNASIELFDTHCHLNLESIGDNWRILAERAVSSGVTKMNNIGSGIDDSKRAVRLAKDMGSAFIATVGVHPNNVHEEPYSENFDFVFDNLADLCKEPEVKAIGETGLDYLRMKQMSERTGIAENRIRELQFYYFERFIKFAAELDLALVLHCRDAYEDFYDILKKNLKSGQRAVVHFYVGDAAVMKRLLDLGLYIGFTGVITYPDTDSYEENVKNIPLEKIVIETDSPFAAPVPYRGQDNEPSYLVEVAKRATEIKGIQIEELASATTDNAKRLFGLK